MHTFPANTSLVVVCKRSTVRLTYCVTILRISHPKLVYRLWAMACIYGYRAYGETPLLSLAENVWTETSKWVITASNVQSGSHTEKTPKFSGTCNGSTYLVLLIRSEVYEWLPESLEGGIFYVSFFIQV